MTMHEDKDDEIWLDWCDRCSQDFDSHELVHIGNYRYCWYCLSPLEKLASVAE